MKQRILDVSILFLIAFGFSFAAIGPTFEDIQRQPAIASSYNFRPLPPDAGKGITVAIISQGITPSVEKLLGDRLSTYSVLSGDPKPYEEEEDFSCGGRLVSIMGALAPQAKILSIKVMDPFNAEFKDIQNGIIRAIELGAKIIILPISSPDDDSGITGAINDALEKGVLVVASAANNNGEGDAGFPARLYGVVAIGAVDAKGKVAYFSNYGGKIIFAPGVSIIDASGGEGSSGTSQSAVVGGAVFAVLWSQNPSLSRQQLVEAVMMSSKAIDNSGGGTAKLIDGQAALRVINKPL